MRTKHLFRFDQLMPSTPQVEDALQVNEFFCDSIQGEGQTVGAPSAFLRLSGCTLDCVWCDTPWRNGRLVSFTEIFEKMEEPYFNLIEKFKQGQHLVVTGGSPLKQQKALANFFHVFTERYGFCPIIEVENECMLMPLAEFALHISYWNNSPKLANSEMKRQVRYKPNILDHMDNQHRSTFKFVVSCDYDWQEIKRDFLDTKLIKKENIILMPQAETVEELRINEPIVAEMAITYSVTYCTRLQLNLNIS
jgi:7-carboxy-7-deazaguanine synthase